jgi:membrane protein
LRLPAIPRELADFGARSLRRFVDIEGAQQATVLAAQAFTSLIPFMVVAAALGPGDKELSERIVERFSLDGSAARSVRTLFNDAGEVESAVTWVGIVILVLSALSFTRAMQRMFERAYGHERRGPKDVWRGFVWLVGFATWLVVSSALRDAIESVGGSVLAVALTGVTGFVFWLATPMLLLGRLDWRRLAPGAVVSAVLGALVGVASAIYVPILMTWSADRYGLIGIAFSMQSWLLVVGFVAVIGAVIGAVASELYGDRIDGLARPIFRRREVGGSPRSTPRS